jgi:hypothetical protein
MLTPRAAQAKEIFVGGDNNEDKERSFKGVETQRFLGTLRTQRASAKEQGYQRDQGDNSGDTPSSIKRVSDTHGFII